MARVPPVLTLEECDAKLAAERNALATLGGAFKHAWELPRSQVVAELADARKITKRIRSRIYRLKARRRVLEVQAEAARLHQ